MTVAMLTSFFGWMTLIHFVLILVASLAIFGFRDKVVALHSRLTGTPKDSLPALYFQWMGTYKLLIFVFALVPWLALKLM